MCSNERRGRRIRENRLRSWAKGSLRALLRRIFETMPMALLALAEVTTGAFAIAPSLAAGVLTVRLQGTGDTAAVLPLESFLEAAGKQIPELDVHAVVFDVRS